MGRSEDVASPSVNRLANVGKWHGAQFAACGSIASLGVAVDVCTPAPPSKVGGAHGVCGVPGVLRALCYSSSLLESLHACVVGCVVQPTQLHYPKVSDELLATRSGNLPPANPAASQLSTCYRNVASMLVCCSCSRDSAQVTHPRWPSLAITCVCGPSSTDREICRTLGWPRSYQTRWPRSDPFVGQTRRFGPPSGRCWAHRRARHLVVGRISMRDVMRDGLRLWSICRSSALGGSAATGRASDPSGRTVGDASRTSSGRTPTSSR